MIPNSAYAKETNAAETTFIDELCRHVSNDMITAYLQNECFDTDSLKMDMRFYGNIATRFKKQSEEIVRFIRVNGATFCVGLRFYYWDYYKNRKADTQRKFRYDHCGYNVYELFVQERYSSFKEEALNYIDFDMDMYKDKTIKVNKYLQTEEIKKMQAKGYLAPYYEITMNEFIQFGHLFALTLYCDFTKLSAAFSATFRKRTKYETLQSIKRRNAVFYWMGRRLRELVEVFGQRTRVDYYANPQYSRRFEERALCGYFYCGMDCKMGVDAFSMHLNGPTSTSRQFEVAVKFSGDNGMIFTFDNPQTDPRHLDLRGWDCSWFSDFKQEDEVLFFGGYCSIKVVTVRLMATMTNYQNFIEAIWYFDSMISGECVALIKKPKNTFYVLKNLINYVLKKPVKLTFDEYVIDIFLCFVNNKRRIVLDLGHLKTSDKIMKSGSLMLATPNVLRNRNQMEKRADTDFTNLFSTDLLRLFPNAQSMEISSRSYNFSLIALLSLISDSNLKNIHISAWKGNWIQQVWDLDKAVLTAKYFAKRFVIFKKSDQRNDFLRIQKEIG